MSFTQHLVFSFLEFLNSDLESRSEDERESLEGTVEASIYYFMYRKYFVS